MPLRPCGVCGQPSPDGRCVIPGHWKGGAQRAARRSGDYGRVWKRIRNRALVRAAGRCVYCAGAAATGDHVIPESRGGATEDDNVLAACGTCNTSKGARTLREWIESGTAPPGATAVLEERVRNHLPV